MNKNILQLRNGFVNLTNAKGDNYQLAMSVMSELMQFGYVLDQSAIDNMKAASKEDIISFHDEVIAYLKDMTGSNRNFVPFWKGFPTQVMEMTECELWMHQLVNYFSGGAYEPNEWTKNRPTAFEQPKYTTLTAGDEDRFLKVFTDLVSVNNSLTPDDMSIIEWFVNSGVELRYPNTIPFKENLCTLAGMGLDVPVKTVTDVLRIAVHMSGGDISLPKVAPKLARTNAWSNTKSINPAREAFKFKKFKRAERRMILGLLEKTNCNASEAVLKDQRWVRLGEILHPGEYKSRFPRAFEMFNKIRNEKVQSWYGQVDAAFKLSFEAGLKKLTERPGELFRRIDELLRNNGTERKQLVFNAIDEVAPRVSNKVLFELYSHLEKRRNPFTGRSVMIKGARKRTNLPDLKALTEFTVNTVQSSIKGALSEKFSSLDSLGKVWVDEELKKIPLPSNMRSSNSSLAPVVRGQRTPVGNENSKTLRAFVHWFDENGTEDLDLSATFIGMGKRAQMSYSTSHVTNYACHSGDVLNRPGACAEYIDINIDECRKEGFKYVIIDVRNYKGRPMHTMKDTVVGYMEREFAESNENFVPATIAGCTKLQGEASTTLVSIVDVETREVIHLDIDASGIPVASQNVEAIIEAIKPYCEPPAYSVYDLVMAHVDARAEALCGNKDEADVKFEYEDFSTSYVKTLQLMGV